MPNPARHAEDIRRADQTGLEQYLHLFMINRGIVLTPFHNMMLCAPTTTLDDVHVFLNAFEEWIQQVKPWFEIDA